MQQEPKVNIFILHFGSPVETFNCLESCLNLNYSNFNIVLIDNDPSQILKTEFSKKYDIEYLNQYFVNLKQKKVFIVNTCENLGFSGGFNFGINKMKKYERADFAWLLNNDLNPNRESLNNLVVFSEKKSKLAMLGSIVKEGKKSFFGSSLKLINGNTNKLTYNNQSQKQIDKIIVETPSYTIDGSAIFLNFNVLKPDFALPTKYFLFFEELYLATKIKKLNLNVEVCVDSVVSHTGSVNSDKISRNKIYYIFRNKIAFYKEFYPQFLFFAIVYQFTRMGLGFLLKGKFKEFGWITNAIIDGICL